ncbi:MAG: hypothetical protein LBS59_04800, partial [Puniceicoccales bacterium]|nr:hypothetical protein [Puniceicoccales bacterium]
MKSQPSRAFSTRATHATRHGTRRASTARVLVAAASLLALGTTLPPGSSFVPRSSAVVFTGTTDFNWDTPANWTPATVPNSPGAVAEFNLASYPGLVGQTISIPTGGVNVGQIVFSATLNSSESLSLANGPLSFSNPAASPIALHNGGKLFFDSAVTASSQFSVLNFAAVGSITFNSTLNVGSNPLSFTTSGSNSSITANAALTAGSFSLSGGGLYTFNAANTFSAVTVSNGGTFLLGANNALGSNAPLETGVSGSSNLIFSLSGAGNRTLSNALTGALYSNLSLTARDGATGTRLTFATSTVSTVSVQAGNGDTITVDPGLSLNFGVNQNFSGATLNKSGGGTLSLRGTGSTFQGLSIAGGTVEAYASSRANLNGTSGILGLGNISISNTNSRLLLTGTAAGSFGLDNTASISLSGESILETSNVVALRLRGGSLNLGTSGIVLFNGPVTLGNTVITGTTKSGALPFGGNIIFTDSTTATANYPFTLTSASAQTLSRGTTGSVTLAHFLTKTGSGITTLDPSITQFTFNSGMRLEAGTFAVSSVPISSTTGIDIINGILSFSGSGNNATTTGSTPFVFSGDANYSGTIALYGNDRTLSSATIASGTAAKIEIGGNKSSANNLTIGTLSFSDATSKLAIYNYTHANAFTTSTPTPDVVTVGNTPTTPQLSNQIWFYGYNQGVVYSAGSLAPKTRSDTVGGIIYSTTPDYLQVTWTGATGAAMNNYQNWKTTTGNIVSPLALPNGPGVEITFGELNSTTPSYSGSWTLGKVLLSSASVYTLQLGTLTLDSGVEGKPAVISISGLSWQTVQGSITLNSDVYLKGNNGVYFNPTITGSKDIYLEQEGTLPNTNPLTNPFYGYRFGGNNSSFTGNIILKSGSISRNNVNAFGNISSTSLLNGTTNNIIFAGGSFRGFANQIKIDVPNKILFQAASTKLSNVNFTFKGDVLLQKTTSPSAINAYTLDIHESTTTAGQRASVSFSDATNLTGDAGLTKAGAQPMEILSRYNTFSGGLTISNGTLWTTIANSAGLRIGALESGKNYLGTGNISLGTSASLLRVETKGNPTVINGTPANPVTINLGTNANSRISFEGGGSVTLGPNASFQGGTGGEFSFSGNLILDGASLGNRNFLSDTSTAIGGANTISKGSTGPSLITGNAGINSLVKLGPGTTTLASELTFEFNIGVYVNGGVLKLTKDNQIKTSSGLILAGGTLDLSNTTQDISSTTSTGLYLRGNGALVLGATGDITLRRRMADTSANWSSTAQLLIQNSTGKWDNANNNYNFATLLPDTFVRFEQDPSIGSIPLNLSNITFSGYESGARVLSLGSFYYLLPADDAAPTIEWSGGGGATTTWSNGANWLGGVVPNGANATTVISASFRDIDSDLSTKTINVDGAYALTRLNVESGQNAVTIGGAGTLSFPKNNTVPSRIAHSGGSVLTVGSTVTLGAGNNVEIAANVVQSVGYIKWTGTVGGEGSFTKTGPGVLLLMNDQNTYSGGFNWTTPSIIQLGGANATANSTKKYFGNGTLNIGTGNAAETFTLETYNAQLAAGSVASATTIRHIASNVVLRGSLKHAWQTNLGTRVANTNDDQGNIHFTGNVAFGTTEDIGKTFNLILQSDGTSSLVRRTSFTFSGSISGEANISQSDGAVYLYGNNTNFHGNYIMNSSGFVFVNGNPNPFGVGGKLIFNGEDNARYTRRLIANSATTISNELEIGGSIWLAGTLNFNRAGTSTISGTVIRISAPAGTLVTFGKDHVLTGTAGFEFGLASSYNTFGTLRFLGENTFTQGLVLGVGDALIQTGRSSVKSGTTLVSGGFGTGTISWGNESSGKRIGAYVGQDSIDPTATSITMSNPVDLSRPNIRIENTGVGVPAPKFIWDTPTIALRNGKLDLYIETLNTSVLRIESQLTDGSYPGGITKTGPGTLELTNTSNVITAGIEVQAGVVYAEFTGASGTLEASALSIDRPFGTGGTGSRLTQTANRTGTAGAFEIHALSANAMVTLDPAGLARYILNDNGQLRITGTNVTTSLGAYGTLNSTETNSARAGALVAEKVLATNFSLGAKLQAATLTLSNRSGGSGFVLTKPNLLSGVQNIVLENSSRLDLNLNPQTIPSITLAAGAMAEILFGDADGTYSPSNPLEINLSSLNIGENALLSFPDWVSPPDDSGYSLTRIVANTTSGGNLQPNVLVRGVKLAGNDTTTAIVKQADDAKYILLPFDNDFIWDGTTSKVWTSGNWAKPGTPNNYHADQTSPGVSPESPSGAIFDTAQNQFTLDNNGIFVENTTPSLADNDEITINSTMSLLALDFRGPHALNYKIKGTYGIHLTTGSAGANTQTNITNTGAANVTIDVPIESPYDLILEESKSATVAITQGGTGNLVFQGAINGPKTRYTVTSDPGAGYVAFKGTNSFDRGFVLNSGTVLVGSNTAFGTNNSLFIWKDGTVKSIATAAGNFTAEAHVLPNPYQLNPTATNGVLTVGEGSGNLTFQDHGAVMKDTTLHVANAATTLTLGGANTNLDANTAGAALTLTGAGKVAIAAKTVGFADQTRSGSTT